VQRRDVVARLTADRRERAADIQGRTDERERVDVSRLGVVERLGCEGGVDAAVGANVR
jgi:hypothetical protein